MNTSEKWREIDQYFSLNLQSNDSVMDSILKANEKAGLPAIDVSPNQGKFLYLLAMIKGVKEVLEIGTLGGYSSVWLGRALPEAGRLVTLEYSEKHAAVAKDNIKRAGLADKINIIIGPALETLPTLEQKGYSSFDLIFIDADKPNNPHYLKWALRLANPGTVIILDNVVRNGKVAEANTDDASVLGVRQAVELLSKEPRIDATAIQTVGAKGYDGFVLGVVKAD